MRLSTLLIIVLFFLHEVSAAEASSKKTNALMKPHDHTGRALDIMTRRDVLHFDYGMQVYVGHCARCHGADRHGGIAPSLSPAALKRFETISDLFLYIKKGCSGKGTPAFESLGDIPLIFVSRYIKRPLKNRKPSSPTGVKR